MYSLIKKSKFKEILRIKKLSEQDILKAYVLIFVDIPKFGDNIVHFISNHKKYVKEILLNKHEIKSDIYNITQKVLKRDKILNGFEKINTKDIKCSEFINNRYKISRKLEVKDSILNIFFKQKFLSVLLRSKAVH